MFRDITVVIGLITALLTGLMLCLQPAPGIAHAIAKATPTHNFYDKRNAGSSRSCRHQPKARERTVDFLQSEEGRRLLKEGRLIDSNPNADACLSNEGEYIRQSKACPERV
jgi:hypothetical protein